MKDAHFNISVMSEDYLMPRKEDIESALKVELMVTDSERPLYMECMNNVPMSQRSGARSIRDGCILSGVFWECSGRKSEDYPNKFNEDEKKRKLKRKKNR